MNATRRITRILRRRREPGEVATPIIAIRNFCLECCGYQPSEVKLCTAPKCWLYPYRFGCRPEAAARRGRQVEGNTSDAVRKSGGTVPLSAAPGGEKP